jgi:hypothetical protein
VPLEFAAHQSYFVVFPKRAGAARPRDGTKTAGNFARYETVTTLAGSWTVRFDPKRGGPGDVDFATLEDWTKRQEPGIKHYSGKATYSKRFDAPGSEGQVLFLDLGAVKNIAEVRLNGKRLGIVWTAPWRIHTADALRAKDNLLEIDVVNLWPNRLIGDAALPPENRLTRTNIQVERNAPLLPSGLLGPVTLQKQLTSKR